MASVSLLRAVAISGAASSPSNGLPGSSPTTAHEPASSPRPRPSRAITSSNVVQVFEVGEDDGHPTVRSNMSPAAALPNAPPQAAAAARQRGTKSRSWARAVQYVTTEAASTATSSRQTCCSPLMGRPKITDFGLACQVWTAPSR